MDHTNKISTNFFNCAKEVQFIDVVEKFELEQVSSERQSETFRMVSR